MANSFILQIADVNISVTVINVEITMFCKDYIKYGLEPHITITMNEADIEKERLKAQKTDENVFRPYYESIALFRKVADELINFDVILLHGSAIEVEGEAFLFTAPSGTGKSTHALKWKEKFDNRAKIINDDKPFVKFENEAPIICGSPWNGKHRRGCNMQSPLKAICFLERAEDNAIEKLTAEDAYAYILKQTYIPSNPEQVVKVLSMLPILLEKVPVYRMKVNNYKEDAVDVAYRAMKCEGC